MSDSTADPELILDQVALRDLWEAHVNDEFVIQDAEATLSTMAPDAHVNHVPVLTGGTGHDELRAFYSSYFVPQMPPDTEITLMSRTVGAAQLVDEIISSLTHTVPMAWMLPGVAPTGKRVEVPTVAVIGLRDGKFAFEHIYWDQASVLVQIGLLDADTLPIAGVESAHKLQTPRCPRTASSGGRGGADRTALARAKPSSLDGGLPRTLCLCGCSAQVPQKRLGHSTYRHLNMHLCNQPQQSRDRSKWLGVLDMLLLF